VDATQKLLRFGVFELNLTTEELRKNGTLLKLQPQPFRILVFLASRAGQIVMREEIRQQIWGGETYVDFEHGMNQCIKQIRTALGDNTDNPVYIETLPRRGYRFLAPVTSKTIAAPPPRVVESKSGILPSLTSASALRDAAAATGHAPIPAEIQPPAIPATPAATPAVEAAPSRASTYSKRWMRLSTAAFVVAVLVGLALYWRTRQARALPERDTVVLADFNNSTGEAGFGTALRQALTFDLEQSPFLNVLSDERIFEELRYMGHGRDTPLTQDMTRQVCQRSGSKAMIVGSISALGSSYQVGLDAINCATGDSLGREVVEASSREQVTRALNKAATAMRRRLGESLASVEKFNKPAEEATTPSLEALVAFNQARKAQITGDGDPIFYFKRALELDPHLAVAYVGLAVAYDNAGQVTLAIENYSKAYELRDRVSQQERFYIEGHYYDSVTGELDKAGQVYSQWAQSYPGSYKPHENLSANLAQIGQYDKAAAEALETIRLSPNNVLAYTDLVNAYNALGRPADARAVFEQAQARGLEYPVLGVSRYLTAFLQGDSAAMQRQADWAQGKSGAEDMMLSAQADTEAWHGRFAKARWFTQWAVLSARRADAPERAAMWKANAALREAAVGNASPARQQATEALAMLPGRDVRMLAALALALAADPAAAGKLAQQLDQEHPRDTMMQVFSLPCIEAAIQLADNAPGRAIDVLQAAAAYELGNQAFGFLYPAYLRGEAYLKAGQGQLALAEYQKVLRHPGIMSNFVTGALAHLQLARAQAMSGDREGARRSYREFLSLWKDADANLPILQAAQAEYQRLN